eukprot:scaffold3618_cov129-Cylindrotheca_fusiformis.AAC.22
MASTESNVGCENGFCRPKTVTNEGAQSSISQSNTKKPPDEANGNKIKVDIISDTMCPWCWVGKRGLEQALAEMPEIQADVNWLPYFLDKNLPEDGKPVPEYYRDNYGDAKTGERMNPHLVEAGKDCGIDFETNYIHVTHFRPTIRSHRLIQLAKRHGKQDAMVEALFKMFCEEGKPLNSVDHLVAAAKRAGLDEVNVQEYLSGNEDESEVFEEAAKIEHLAQGVPTFIFTKPGTKLYHTFSGGRPASDFKKVFQLFSSA